MHFILHMQGHTGKKKKKGKTKTTLLPCAPKPGYGAYFLAKTNRRELQSTSILAALMLYFGEYLIYPMPKIYRYHLHEVRPEAMDNCTQRKATFPRGSQICDVNITVPFCLFLTPGQEFVRSNVRLCSQQRANISIIFCMLRKLQYFNTSMRYHIPCLERFTDLLMELALSREHCCNSLVMYNCFTYKLKSFVTQRQNCLKGKKTFFLSRLTLSTAGSRLQSLLKILCTTYGHTWTKETQQKQQHL